VHEDERRSPCAHVGRDGLAVELPGEAWADIVAPGRSAESRRGAAAADNLLEDVIIATGTESPWSRGHGGQGQGERTGDRTVVLERAEAIAGGPSRVVQLLPYRACVPEPSSQAARSMKAASRTRSHLCSGSGWRSTGALWSTRR